MLLPGKTYDLKIRSHRSGSPSLGPGTWGSVGSTKQCQTGASAPLTEPIVPTLAGNNFVIEVMRESEYTNDVDYLMNHASGDMLGDATLVTAMPDSPWASFDRATFTLYCVEVLHVSVSNTDTNDDDRFADYVSCNMGRDHSRPTCECDFWIDRSLGGTSTSMCDRGCSQMNHRPPSCNCHCSSESSANSAKYTGMMPVRFHSGERLGSWYSHPQDTECAEDENLGQLRGDGSQCTWKRRGEARVVTGEQVRRNGFRSSGSLWRTSASSAKSNKEAFQRTFDQQSLKPWSCTNSPSPTPPGPTPTPTPVPTPTPSPTPSPTPQQCHAISPVVDDDWCIQNCAAGFCPADLCECPKLLV